MNKTTYGLKYRIRSLKDSEFNELKEMLLSMIKVKTFTKASSSVKSVVVLLRDLLLR